MKKDNLEILIRSVEASIEKNGEDATVSLGFLLKLCKELAS